jgi:hypothetical protein
MFFAFSSHHVNRSKGSSQDDKWFNLEQMSSKISIHT